MRTNLEFASAAFPPRSEDEQVNEGRYGKALADHLAAQLPRHGFDVESPDPEDWGWRLDLADNSGWIGCGNYEEFEDGFLIFIEQRRSWFRRAKLDVEALADALEKIVRSAGATRIRWWGPDER